MSSLESIHAAIPHRPPFLFIDEILEVTETGARARRVIRPEEPHFEGHYPGNPIMPGVLLCEAVFQTAAVYLVKRLAGEDGGGKTPILARIGNAKFKSMVKPGDEITIEVSFKETLSQFHFLTGKVLKNDKPAVSLEFALALIDESKESA